MTILVNNDLLSKISRSFVLLPQPPPAYPPDMRFREIPDDVWIEIFENVSEPATLARLVRTCHRFQDLAKKPLLREIRWFRPVTTNRNIDSWRNGYKDLVSLPRKLTLSLTFHPNGRNRVSLFMLCYSSFLTQWNL